jgi:hypothetical protein
MARPSFAGAKRAGRLTVPQSILLSADEVIE